MKKYILGIVVIIDLVMLLVAFSMSLANTGRTSTLPEETSRGDLVLRVTPHSTK